MGRGRWHHLLLSLVVIGASCPVGRAQEKSVTTSYDVDAFIGGEVLWLGKKVKFDSAEAVAALIAKKVDPKSWRDERFFIHEVNGTRLDIRTTPANHKEIAQFLAALRRLLGVSVIVEAGVYEMERAAYEKMLAPEFAKNRSQPLPLDEAGEKAFRAAARLATKTKTKLDLGKEQLIFSRRRALPYDEPGRLPQPRSDGLAFVGIRLAAEAHVSQDRRIVRLRLTKRCSELLEMRKENATDDTGAEVEIEIPRIRESSTTVPLTVGDDVLVLIPPSVPVPGFTSKDRVPLLFLRPNITIAEEEVDKPQ